MSSKERKSSKEGGEGEKKYIYMLSGPEILNSRDVAPLIKYCFCQLGSHHLRNSCSNAYRKSFAGICCSSTGRICQHSFAEIIIKAKMCLCYPSAPESDCSHLLPLLLPLLPPNTILVQGKRTMTN